MDVALERQRLDSLEAKAEAAVRGNIAKTAVLHVVAHDLRPLVHAVADAAEALPARDEQWQALRAPVVRAVRLVDDLVDLSRLESGTLRTSPDSVDLHEVVAAAAEHARIARGDHAIDLELPARPRALARTRRGQPRPAGPAVRPRRRDRVRGQPAARRRPRMTSSS